MAGISYRWLGAALWACALLTCQAGQHWIGAGPRVVTWTGSQPADRVRLGVRDEGVYRVTAAEIAAAAGVAEPAARAALDAGGLTLSCQGRPVAWMADDGALYFYGVPTAELFAPENVYWLAFGSGQTMAVADAAPAEGSATNQWFMGSASYRSSFLAPYEPRDRRSTGATLTNVLNFGECVAASVYEETRSRSQLVEFEEFCGEAATGGVVRVALASYKNGAEFANIYVDTHTCEVWLNGTSCGAQSWQGEQAPVFEYAVAPGVVTNGTVRLTVRNGLSASDISDFLLLDAALVLPRRYRARAGAMLCTGGADPTVSADGFGSPRIAVWDVTAPELPLVLDAPVWQATNGEWQVAFACGDASRRYAAFDAAAGGFEPAVSGVRDTDWRAAGEMPALAIVIPPQRWVTGFAEAVQPLADFRAAQGLSTRVIDAEELYNAFSDGLVHPAAFQRFSAAGVTNAAAPTLRYLLFAGNGGTDYKLDAFKFGVDERCRTLFPLYLIPQEEPLMSAALLLPNDPVLGNALGGEAPEVAVGRFVATNATELAGMVAKTIRYEVTEAWKNKAVFSACSQFPMRNDPDFTAIAQNTAAGFVAGGWSVSSFYPSQNDDDIRELWMDAVSGTGVKAEFLSGAGFFYYVGHSGDVVAGTTSNKDKALVSDLRLNAGGWSFAPVALMMGCRMGRWTLLNFKTGEYSLCEAGVRNRTSGFTAAISEAGYLMPADARAFSYAFCDQVASGALRLGDVWCGAFAALGDTAAARMQHLTLLGDPSLCIRAGTTARGTPSAWLIAQGLTGDAYADLKDQDGDGFPTWQEYQAGADYLRKGPHIRGLALPAAAADRVSMSFEALAGVGHRVLSTTNLASGVWESLPWRTEAGGAWSDAAIPGDWPLKAVEVPRDAAERQRFYKVEPLQE